MKRILFFILSLLFFNSCSLFDTESRAGVAITWDVEGSSTIKDWHSQRDYLNDLGVKFTLYIRVPHALTEDDVNWLKDLENDGHEIAYHTRFHSNGIGYIFSENHTIDEYLDYEILPGILDYGNNGFKLKNFSYPNAHHFTELDNRMFEYFDSLRSVSQNINWCFYKFNENRVVCSYWIEKLSFVSEEIQLNDVYAGLRKAKAMNWVVNLYGHRISPETSSGFFVSFKRLAKIVQYARELGLKFYKMEDLFSK